jgi:hypothetical protein
MYLNYDAQLLVKPNRFLRRILHWHLLESDLENVQYQGIVGIGVLFHSRPLLCCRSSLSTLSLSVFSPLGGEEAEARGIRVTCVAASWLHSFVGWGPTVHALMFRKAAYEV